MYQLDDESKLIVIIYQKYIHFNATILDGNIIMYVVIF